MGTNDPGVTPFDASAYLDDEEVIAEYLAACREDENPDVYLSALANVAKARGAPIDSPYKGADADETMTEGTVTATIEDMMLAIRDLGDRMERRFEQVERRFERAEESMMALRAEVAEIKGRISDMPTARDFGRLEGRVAEMSERLPTTIGYTPPRSASGG